MNSQELIAAALYAKWCHEDGTDVPPDWEAYRTDNVLNSGELRRLHFMEEAAALLESVAFCQSRTGR